MDYTKVPRQLFFSREGDIEYYLQLLPGNMPRQFLEKLSDRPFMDDPEASDYAEAIFRNADYICALIVAEIKGENLPKMRLTKYMKIAKAGHERDILWANHIMPATMALVYNMLQYYHVMDGLDAFMIALHTKFQKWDINGSPEGMDEKVMEINKLLRKINEEWKIKL